MYCSTSRRDKVDLHEGCYVFHPGGTDEAFVIAQPDPKQTVYEKIEKRYRELKARGVADDELDLLMEIDIENYFTHYLKRMSRSVKEGGPARIVRPEILQLAGEILKYAGEKLGRKFDEEVLQSLALHIQTSADRIQKGGKIVHPRLNQVRRKYKAAFVAAIDCLKKIEDRLNIDLPIDEAGFLAMFFVLDPAAIRAKRRKTCKSWCWHTETGLRRAMAGVANRLLGNRHASGIDIPLSMSPEAAFERVKNRFAEPPRGCCFCVDMGSLVQFDERDWRLTERPVKTVPMVSTLHVFEAVRKGDVGLLPSSSCMRTLKRLIPFDAEPVATPPGEPQTVKGAIVTACVAGRGAPLPSKRHWRIT